MLNEMLVLSSEHASRRVPREYQSLFSSAAAKRALAAHWGSDIGALGLARSLQRAFQCPLISARVTRLLVDFNRSENHPRLFSAFSRGLAASAKQRVLERYYAPYRTQVKSAIEAKLARGLAVVHVSVHSFTPRLGGCTRRADVGLLYDPARPAESLLASLWKGHLLELIPELTVRRNYPYLGVQDGLTRTLRCTFSAEHYSGLELEVNQRFFRGSGVCPAPELSRALSASFSRSLAGACHA